MNPNSPSHEAVTQRAQQIWRERGRPTGADTEIWLEAERQLSMTASADNAPSPCGGRGSGNSQSSSGAADPKAAAQSETQKKSARAPKTPGKKAPKTTPPESGKPLWDKPHSS